MLKIYLKNYKIIHYLITLLIFVLLLCLFGNKEILTNFPFQIMIMIINYFCVKFSLTHSGLEDEINKKLKEIEKK
jgi:hypothetical protein